ncbi:MAG: hypothetical protein ACREL1_07195 [bacterium]
MSSARSDGPRGPSPQNRQDLEVFSNSDGIHNESHCLYSNTRRVLRGHGGKSFYARIASWERHTIDGVGLYNITKYCGGGCPQSIRVTDNAIIPLKK